MFCEREAGSGLPADYLMIHTLFLDHFRCYEHLKVDGLQRVNVIVGGNGTGKTAILESIFMASGGSPELSLRLQNFRGMGTSAEISGDGLRGLWRDLFSDFDQSKPVKIVLGDRSKKPRSLTISVLEQEEMTLPIEEYEAGSGVVLNMPIEFVWEDINGRFPIKPTLNEQNRIVFPSARQVSRVAFFPAQFKLSPEESAKRLSDLSKTDELKDLVALIREVYPDVDDASVEHNAGSWQVFVKLARMTTKIPIALYSAGASKFVSLMLGIASQEGGCVLIDEIENGFYYERLTEVWKALYAIASESRCQLFVTTHSQECLRALLPVIEPHSKDFALLKTERRNGEPRVFVSAGEVMAAAIQSGFELR